MLCEIESLSHFWSGYLGIYDLGTCKAGDSADLRALDLLCCKNWYLCEVSCENQLIQKTQQRNFSIALTNN